MGDFFLEFYDGSRGDTGRGVGMPIPRAPGSRAPQPHHYQDITSMTLQMDDHSPLPIQQQGINNLQQWERNIMPSGLTHQDNFCTSPVDSNSPSLWVSQSMDLDLDPCIKMEPLEELQLLPTDLLPDHTLSLNSSGDVLLEDVSWDDLLMPEQYSSQPPEHPSSPLPMMAVHPDEVMDVKKNLIIPNSSNNYYTSSVAQSVKVEDMGPSVKDESVTQPIKAESTSLFSLLASSFPPQGGGWRDPLLTSSSLPGQHANTKLGSIEECPSSDQHQQTFSPQHHTINHISGSTSALQELLLQSPSTPLSPQSVSSPQNVPSPQEPPMGQSVPRPTSLSAANPLLSARLSSSAPTNNFSLEQAWQRREPRQHLLSTGSLAEEFGGSASSLSTECVDWCMETSSPCTTSYVGGILSPSSHDLTIDDAVDSDEESDNEHYDSESDNDSVLSEDAGCTSGMSKKERYFWQYNVQAKGPKGQRVSITQQQRDPYSLPSVMDPVFSPMCSIQGIKHSGKARRGDGNDLTPNPRKLVSIGRELDKLNRTINDMTPVSELPFNIRPKSRKEKNKLASRACRLKKKAQHEANKIKLYGLEQEHKGLMNSIQDVRTLLARKMDSLGTSPSPIPSQSSPSTSQGMPADLTQYLDKMVKIKYKQRIAGHTTDFVNKVIENCQNGNSTGGLEEITKTFSNTNLASSPNLGTTGLGFSPH